MADAVTSETYQDGNQIAVFKFTNISDGSGESAVKKIDVSALSKNARGESCTRVTIEKMWWQCIGMKVRILFDASTDDFCIELGENQSGDHDYTSFGGW